MNANSLGIKFALDFISIFKGCRGTLKLVNLACFSSIRRDSSLLASADRRKLDQIRRKRTQNRLLAAGFSIAGTCVFVYSIVAVVSSRHVCEPFEQCKVISYRWNVGAESCSCIVFVDRELRVKTFAEWENPVDASASLTALATAGNLKIIQIINKKLRSFPNELRRCHALEQLILIYTNTVSIPEWAKEFSRLEYFHLEGDMTARELTSLAPDLFRHMKHLMFLHLGTLLNLTSLPEMDQLPSLKYLVLSTLHSVDHIPSLENLHGLRKVGIIDMIRVMELPSVHNLRHLNSFALTYRNPTCCNDFITGECDLTNFSCLDRTAQGEPPVACTTKRGLPQDYVIMMQTDGQVCESNQTVELIDLMPTEASVDGACGGVTYKKCTKNDRPGMCFPARLQPVSCQTSGHYQAMRRLHIKRGVGEPCDPTIEAWLGCKP